MKLSQEEIKIIRRWRRAERWRPWTAAAAFGVGLLLIGLSCFLIKKATSYPVDSAADAAILAWVLPLIWGMMAAGGYHLGLAAVTWCGDSRMKLLLRLLEEHVDDT